VSREISEFALAPKMLPALPSDSGAFRLFLPFFSFPPLKKFFLFIGKGG
jgi:hypothetical protein